MDVGKNDEYIPFFSPAYFQLGPDAMEEKYNLSVNFCYIKTNFGTITLLTLARLLCFARRQL
jgi:hypothetical protein